MLHHWLEAMDGSGFPARVALLDYKKAFDLVDHNLLVAKLYSIGVKSLLLLIGFVTFCEADLSASNLIPAASRNL